MLDDEISKLASTIGEQLALRGETVSVAESTTGGLISASLLAVPGASRFYLGGSVVYTRASRHAFLDFDKQQLAGLKPLTEEMAQAFADAARQKLNATWGLSELGASGPADSPYGHPAGSSVFAVAGPHFRARLLQTGSSDREQNMVAFTKGVLTLFAEVLDLKT